MTDWVPGPALAAYHAGVTVVCQLAAQFTDEAWAAPTPCPEWRAVDLAGHLRCVADDYHEYLGDAPVSRRPAPRPARRLGGPAPRLRPCPALTSEPLLATRQIRRPSSPRDID